MTDSRQEKAWLDLREEEGGKETCEGISRPERANLLNRFLARFIDFLVVAAMTQVLPPIGIWAGITYLFMADGLSQGRSLGKRVIGLQTIQVDQLMPCTYKESLLRNFPLVLGYLVFFIPYVGWFLAALIVGGEAIVILGNPRGMRIGDEVARTQVIDVPSGGG